MTLLKCFLLVFVLTFATSVRSECYFNECDCEEYQVVCKALTEFPSRNFQYDNGMESIPNVEIIESDIARIPAGRMDGMDIEMANFRESGISDIDPHAFDNAKIYQINLKNNKIYHIDERTFTPLADTLEILILGYNDLHFMGNDLNKPLQGLKKLSTLTLSGNKLKQIPNLSSMASCKDLQLNDNEISELLDYNTGEPLLPDGLVTLNLEHNKLMQLNPDSFKNLQRLKFFNLDNNLIESINADTFKYLPNLHTLSIKKNMIAHIPESVFRAQAWISKVDFSSQNRMLKSISNYAFSRPASSNVFDTLDLSNNQLESLPDKVFCNLDKENPYQKFKTVFLAANLMMNLNPCIIRQLESSKQSGIKTKVNFNHNPAIHVDRNQYYFLTCNCNVTMAAEAVDLVGQCQKHDSYYHLMEYKCDTEASNLDEYCEQFPQFNCDHEETKQPEVEIPKYTKLTPDFDDDFKKTNRPHVNNVVNTHTSSNNNNEHGKNRQNHVTKKPSQIKLNSSSSLTSWLATTMLLVASATALISRY